MSKPNVQVSPKTISPIQQESPREAPASTFSDDEIRVRAYQIYESSDRTNTNADQDWFQAQTELMKRADSNWPSTAVGP